MQWDQSWISKSQNWTACIPNLVIGVANPFKHKVYRGLQLRKAAFQSLEAIFNRDSDNVDVLKIVDAILNLDSLIKKKIKMFWLYTFSPSSLNVMILISISQAMRKPWTELTLSKAHNTSILCSLSFQDDKDTNKIIFCYFSLVQIFWKILADHIRCGVKFSDLVRLVSSKMGNYIV